MEMMSIDEIKEVLLRELYTIPSVKLAHYGMRVARETEDIDLLKKLRKEMIRRHFGSSSTFVYTPVNREDSDVEADEAADRGKQLRIFREITRLKKNALEVVRAAIYYYELKAKLSPKLAKHLPLMGDYIGSLLPLNYNAILAYKHLIELLTTTGDTEVVKGYVVDDLGVNYVVSEDWLNLHKDLVSVKEKKEKKVIKPLIRLKIVRKLLATAAVSAAYEELNTLTEDDELLIKYNKILADHYIVPYTLLDAYTGYEDVKDKLVQEGLGYWQDEIYYTKDTILSKLREKKKAALESIEKRAAQLLANELYNAYKKGEPLPGTIKKPTLTQINVLSMLSKDISPNALKELVE